MLSVHRPNELRFTATDQSGQQIARLDVATGGRTRPVDQVDRTYLVRDGQMYPLSQRNTGRMAMRMGPVYIPLKYQWINSVPAKT